MPLYFEYDQAGLDHLAARDRRLGRAIERLGPVRREVDPDLFRALVHSLISQQISAKAAQTVGRRLEELTGGVTPETLGNLSLESLQKCGTSFRKAGYILDLALRVRDGELDLEGLRDASDEEVVTRLSGLKGIGRWTAEMLLIFSLGRPDVLSWDDLALHRGLRRLYGHRQITRPLFEKYRRRYSPYGSVAALYLWALSSEPEPAKTPAARAPGRAP